MGYIRSIKGREYSDNDSIQITRGERFFKIWDFMIGDFELEKTELLVYAMIFGIYRQFCDSFMGSRDYLAKWTNSSNRSVDRALKSLEEKKLIKKYYTKSGKTTRAVYYINTEALPSCKMFDLENRNKDNNKKIRELERRKTTGIE